MSTPIGNNLQTLFDDVRQVAYKRGHLAARLEVLKAIDQLKLEQRTGAQAISDLLKALEAIDTPTQAPKPKRTRKPKE